MRVGTVISVERKYEGVGRVRPHFTVIYEFNHSRWRGSIIADDELDAWRTFQKKLDEEGVVDPVLRGVEMADFIGKSLIAAGVFRKAGKVPESFLKSKITQYK